MSIEIIDNYCEHCGAKYSFQKETIHQFCDGDWFGHYPDHYRTVEKDNLKSIPCPSCGKINERHITLKQLEDIVIKGMSTEEKYLYILSEKKNNNIKKINKINKEISEVQDCIKSCEETIKSLLKKVNLNKKQISDNDLVIKQLQCITVEIYKKQQIDSLHNKNKQLEKEVISFFINRKCLLKNIKKYEDDIEQLKNNIFKIQKENKFYEYEINGINGIYD